MKIERMYVDRPDVWEEISEQEFIRRTEWAGYWKKGTALQVLKDCAQSGATFRTPWAFYRMSFEDSPTLAEVNARRRVAAKVST